MAERIRILIADDHAVVRRGLRALIESQPEMELLGEAADGVEAVELARTLRPDVIVLDLIMPRQDGIAAIGAIKRENFAAKILVLTSFVDDNKVFPAIKAGALGYVLKDSSPAELLQAIFDVYRGEASLHPTVARKLIREFNRGDGETEAGEALTEREIEVVRLVAQGMTNQEISEQLAIREGTVRIHVGNILNKLHLSNRTQAALYALRSGLADLNSP